MSPTEWIPVAASIVAIAAVVAGIVRDRRRPELDAAQTKSTMVDIDSVKLQIRKMSDESNSRRDLRILDLEHWGDEMRGWGRNVRDLFYAMSDIVREDRRTLGKDMPDLKFPEPPPFPPPRV